MKQLILILIVATMSKADGFRSFNAGLSWPKTLSNLEGSDQFSWNFGMASGGSGENPIGLSFNFDVLVQNSEEQSGIIQDTSTYGGVYEVYSDGIGITRVQISTGIGAWVVPIEGNVIRPVFRGSFMPSLMILANDFDTDDDDEVYPPSGGYWGFTATLSGETHVMISKNLSFFGGAGYRFGSVRKRVRNGFLSWDEEEIIVRQPMDGFAVTFGFQTW